MSRPGVFGLPHLSEDAVAAFADGVLSPAASARARRHCEECAECATAVREQREAAMLLRTAEVPTLPSGLLARLAGLPMSASLPPGLPTGIGPDGAPVFLTERKPAKRPPEDKAADEHDFRRREPAATSSWMPARDRRGHFGAHQLGEMPAGS